MNTLETLGLLHSTTKEIDQIVMWLHHQNYVLIENMVRLQQQYRNAKRFIDSDEIRDILQQAGVEIVRGTNGYEFDKIPEALKGRQVDDTWVFK